MSRLLYFIVCFFSKLLGDEFKNKYFRKCGITVGGGTHIYSNIVTSEPYLIEIGNDVTISTNVVLVTHDNSIIKIDKTMPNLYGKIRIGNNCFIGENAVILYGVTIADNTIVAAGSVVTKSINEERTIVGGNPAKQISTWEKFYQKSIGKGISRYKIKDVYQEEGKLVMR